MPSSGIGDFETFKTMFEKNPSLDRERDEIGYSALHFAAMAGTPQFIEFLLNNKEGLATHTESMAAQSPDAKFLFFELNGDIYWVSARVIERPKPKNLR